MIVISMIEKRTWYCTTIFVLDRVNQSFSVTVSDNDNYKKYLKSYDKHYGLYWINEKNILSIIIEYSNIIGNYKVLYGSCKKKFKPLSINDERWSRIEKKIYDDLEMMGLEKTFDQVMESLKRQECFEYNKISDLQFK